MKRTNKSDFFEKTEADAEADGAHDGMRRDQTLVEKRRVALDYAHGMIASSSRSGHRDVHDVAKSAVRELLCKFGGLKPEFFTERYTKSTRWNFLRLALVTSGVMSEPGGHVIFGFAVDNWGTWR